MIEREKESKMTEFWASMPGWKVEPSTEMGPFWRRRSWLGVKTASLVLVTLSLK